MPRHTTNRIFRTVVQVCTDQFEAYLQKQTLHPCLTLQTSVLDLPSASPRYLPLRRFMIMYNGDEQFYAGRGPYSTPVVDHAVKVFSDASLQESYAMNSFGEISADTPDVKLAFPSPKFGSPYTRQSLPLLNLGGESYTAPNYLISPASSFQYSPESESSPDQNHFSHYPSVPHPHHPSPISDTNFAAGSPNDAALVCQEFPDGTSPYGYNDTPFATFPLEETSPQSYYSPFYGGYEQLMPQDTQAANDVTLYLAHESKQSDIMIDDKRALLKLMGFVDYHHDSAFVSRLFSEKLLASTYSSTSHNTFGLKGLCGRPMKAKISSDAGKAASADRRKVPPSFFCELRGDCGASFTRKNGLINHYKAHLGITDRFCRFCSQAFTTSVGRHERKCKQNPEHQKSSPSMYMMAPLAEYY